MEAQNRSTSRPITNCITINESCLLKEHAEENTIAFVSRQCKNVVKSMYKKSSVSADTRYTAKQT